MTDFVGFIIALFAWVLVRLFGIILLPWSLIITIRNKRLNSYFYEVGRGFDILANKMFAPALNSQMQENGREFGQDETISQCMAQNKVNKTDTDTARWWEKKINIFDKNHLEKTINKHRTMSCTKDQLIALFTDAIVNSSSAGSTTELSYDDLNSALYAALDTVDTVSPNLPPRP